MSLAEQKVEMVKLGDGREFLGVVVEFTAEQIVIDRPGFVEYGPGERPGQVAIRIGQVPSMDGKHRIHFPRNVERIELLPGGAKHKAYCEKVLGITLATPGDLACMGRGNYG